MVLRPVVASSSPPDGYCPPAWSVIEPTQRLAASEYWLVTQPDHAALSGGLAASFVSPDFPAVDRAIARAIGVHDSGWAIFAPEAHLSASPAVDAHGKPLSFLEIEPADFLRAWTASIDGAESVCAAGGYIVSRHFCALGEGRLNAAIDRPDNTARLRRFLSAEVERQQRLSRQSGRTAAELEDLVRVLQFCDLLSLYLCCGASHPVEFPQPFASGKVRLHQETEAFVMEPSPFRAGNGAHAPSSFGVEARRFPSSCLTTTTLAFLLV